MRADIYLVRFLICDRQLATNDAAVADAFTETLRDPKAEELGLIDWCYMQNLASKGGNGDYLPSVFEDFVAVNMAMLFKAGHIGEFERWIRTNWPEVLRMDTYFLHTYQSFNEETYEEGDFQVF